MRGARISKGTQITLEDGQLTQIMEFLSAEKGGAPVAVLVRYTEMPLSPIAIELHQLNHDEAKGWYVARAARPRQAGIPAVNIHPLS